MANLPGLRPFSEDRPDVSRKGRGRVVLKDPGPNEMPRLRPTSTPVDTYTRPAQPPVDNDLKRLSESLAGLNPALLRFGDTLVNQEEREDAEFTQHTQSMTGAQFMQKAMDKSDPIIAKGLNKRRNQELLAATVAREDYLKLKEAWETGNKDGTDIDTLIANQTKETYAKYGGPGRDGFVNAYNNLFTPMANKLRAAKVENDVENTKATQLQGASSLFDIIIEEGRRQGKSGEEIGMSLRTSMLGNNKFANMSFRDQEAELMNKVSVLASQGEVDLVRGALNSQGSNGISLLSSRDYGAKAVKLLELATNTAREKDRESGFQDTLKWSDAAIQGSLDRDALLAYHEAHPGRLTEDQVRGLIATNDRAKAKREEETYKLNVDQMRRKAADDNTVANRYTRRHALATGNYWNIGATTSLKDNGETSEVSDEANRKLAVAEFLEDSRKQAERNQETPQQRVERELPIVMANGFVNEEWKNTLATGVRTASAAMLSGGKSPPALQAAQDLYNTLNARAPNLLPDLLDKENSRYYEYVRVATQEMQMPLDQANSVVLQLTKDPVKLHALKNAPAPKAVEKAVRDLSGATRPGYVMDEIATMTMIYSGLGLSEKEAVSKAKDQFEKTHININGNYIPRHDRNLPPDFEKLVKWKLQDYVEKYGKAEGLDADDLTIQPSSRGTGAWEITDTFGMPVDQVNERWFTLRDLKAWQEQRERALKEDRVSNSPDTAHRTLLRQELYQKPMERLVGGGS